jgi:hypothetical protein
MAGPKLEFSMASVRLVLQKTQYLVMDRIAQDVSVTVINMDRNE